MTFRLLLLIFPLLLFGDVSLSRHSRLAKIEYKGHYVSENFFQAYADWDLDDFVSLTDHVRHYYTHRNWSMSPYDRIDAINKARKHFYKIQEGDTLFVENNLVLDFFIEELIDHIHCNIILITACDATVPEQLPHHEKLVRLMEKGKIIHLFGRNLNLSNLPENATQLPIGICFPNRPLQFKNKRYRPRWCNNHLQNIQENLLPTTYRRRRILWDAMKVIEYCPIEGGQNRSEVLAILQKNDVVDVVEERIPWDLFLSAKAQRAFEVSPPGQGVDCYRTWEALAIGCIVIVPSTYLDPLFEDLPVVKIKDWSEVTRENLEKWLDEFGDVTRDPNVAKKLSHTYWQGKIDKVQKDYFQKLGIR